MAQNCSMHILLQIQIESIPCELINLVPCIISTLVSEVTMLLTVTQIIIYGFSVFGTINKAPHWEMVSEIS